MVLTMDSRWFVRRAARRALADSLPATQDYVIQVVPFGNTQVNYTLQITVQ